MANSLLPYLKCVRTTLQAAFCLRDFPCQQVERHNRPEVEFQQNPELVSKSVLICRSSAEKCLIEPSINSVRVSLKIKNADQMDRFIASMFLRFLMQRAESFEILRKVPVDG